MTMKNPVALPRLFILLVAVCLFLACGLIAEEQEKQSAKDDVQGWRSARWGMTEEEVLAAFPNEAKRLEKPEKYGIVIATVGIKKLQVAGSDFVVHFSFDTEKKRLKQVNLKPDPASKSLNVMLPTLERDLTEKYGKPDFASNQAPRVAGMKVMTRSWKKGATRIELKYVYDPDTNFELLIVAYRPVSASGDKNL